MNFCRPQIGQAWFSPRKGSSQEEEAVKNESRIKEREKEQKLEGKKLGR